MEFDLVANEIRILVALEARPLSMGDVVWQMAPLPESEVKELLYQLNQKTLVIKTPAIDGGCRTCACQVKYTWRLTYRGRQALTQNISRDH